MRFISVLLLVAAFSPGNLWASPSVVVVSIDGFRPDFYESPLFKTPNLKKLVKTGASARGVEGVFPTVTYPSHTTLITGVRPAEHGIWSNTQFDPESGQKKEWYFDSKLIQVKTLWDLNREKKQTTAVLFWPVSVGAPVDWLFPEIFVPGPNTEKASLELWKKTVDSALFEEVVARTEIKTFIDHASEDAWAIQAGRYIWENKKPNLMLIHLVQVDQQQHEFGRNSKETRGAIQQVDALLGSLLEGVDTAKATLFVTGDHGFQDYRKNIHLNRIFEEKGWLKRPSPEASIEEVTDWKVLAHLGGSQAAIYVRDPALEKEVWKVLKANSKLGYRLLDKEQLAKRGSYPKAFAAVSAQPGFHFSNDFSGPLTRDLKKAKGTHGSLPNHPEMRTGLIVVGPEIGAKKELGIVKMEQIAPAIAKALGLELKSSQPQLNLK